MIKLLISYKIRKFQKSRFLFQAEGMMLETSNFLCNLTFEHRTRIRGAQKKLGVWSALIHIQILAASPLASSGFAAIGCFRTSPYGGIYILKNYSKLTAKKPAIFFSKIQIFSPDQNGTNKKEEDRFQTLLQRSQCYICIKDSYLSFIRVVSKSANCPARSRPFLGKLCRHRLKSFDFNH